MQTKMLYLLVGILLGLVSTVRAGIIFGQLTGTPATGTVTYVACVNNNWSKILTEDGINPDAGTDQGYQGGYFRLEAANFSTIHNQDLVTINFSDLNQETGKTISVTVAWNGKFQNLGTVHFDFGDSPLPPPLLMSEITSPGIVWLNWPYERRGITYHIYRSTQASGCNNLASNGRYQLLASKVRPPYIDNTVSSVPGTQAWYLVIAEDPYGRKSGHSPEAYIPDTSVWLKLAHFRGRAIDQAVELTWQLDYPLPIQGFNLYRRSERIGKYIKINSELILTETASGYRCVDPTIGQKEYYFYYIEAIQLEGKAIKSLPIKVSSYGIR